MTSRLERRPEQRATARGARTGWDRAVDVWEDFQESDKDFARDRVHGPVLLEAIGTVGGRRILDLGCGQGRFTRQLAQRGARVTGIDWSAKMIEAARFHEAADPLGVEYLRLDAATAANHLRPGAFDLIVANMSLMDMPRPDRALQGSHRLLKPAGRLVFSITHPLNSAEAMSQGSSGSKEGGALIDHYFAEGPRITRWSMTRLKRPFETVHWHRTFEGWFRILRESGFEITDLREPRASSSDASHEPALRRTRRIPFFLVLSCRRVPLPRRPGSKGSRGVNGRGRGGRSAVPPLAEPLRRAPPSAAGR